jgi:hypothetical protein
VLTGLSNDPAGTLERRRQKAQTARLRCISYTAARRAATDVSGGFGRRSSPARLGAVAWTVVVPTAVVRRREMRGADTPRRAPELESPSISESCGRPLWLPGHSLTGLTCRGEVFRAEANGSGP